jgi:hypothetical protein
MIRSLGKIEDASEGQSERRQDEAVIVPFTGEGPAISTPVEMVQ